MSFIDVFPSDTCVAAYVGFPQFLAYAYVVAYRATLTREVGDRAIDAYIAVTILAVVIFDHYCHPRDYQIGAENFRVLARAVLDKWGQRRIPAEHRKPEPSDIEVSIASQVS